MQLKRPIFFLTDGLKIGPVMLVASYTIMALWRFHSYDLQLYQVIFSLGPSYDLWAFHA